MCARSEVPLAWVLRCPDCLGGLVYALSTHETATLLALGVEHALWPLAWIEEGSIDKVLELDYCDCCPEDSPMPPQKRPPRPRPATQDPHVFQTWSQLVQVWPCPVCGCQLNCRGILRAECRTCRHIHTPPTRKESPHDPEP